MHSQEYTKQESSLINNIFWNENTEELTIVFHSYYVDFQTFKSVSYDVFEEFINSESKGKFYLQYIKKNFLIKKSGSATQLNMANKPKGINKASDKKRFIKLKINVTKFKKEWFIVGQKGVYAELTLQMLPDGQVDGYENLGMITQDVTKEVYQADKTVKGPILGNAAELEWNTGTSESSIIPQGNSAMSEDPLDDLPF